MAAHLSVADRRALMDVALGKNPADLLVRNARVLNVYTGELLPRHDVAVKVGHVAYVGGDASFSIGDSTEVVDAAGQVLSPGLVDGHTHLAIRLGIDEFVRYAAPGGTTTVITELIELASIAGAPAIISMLDALADQPITLLGTLPHLGALARFMEEVAPSIDEYHALLQRDDVVGLGEVYWGNLLGGDQRLANLVVETQRAGKAVEGHTAGARGQRLQAVAAAGISSCHEPITVEEGVERLRLGMYWMARDGEIRRDLEAFAPIWRKYPVDLRRFILVTDSVGPRRLAEEGYLDRSVRKAVHLGLDPIKAIQAATLNVAEHFGLAHRLGGVAPGLQADFFLAPDLMDLRAQAVYSRGRLIARDGQMVVEPRTPSFPDPLLGTVRRPRPVEPDDFRVRANGAEEARVRAIEMVTHLVTRETQTALPVRTGAIESDPDQDVVKVAALNRLGTCDDSFVGFVRGFGLRSGAFGTTMAWDSQCMVVIGANDRDMALAANHLIEIQGGAAVVDRGRVLADFKAPICGILSQAPLPDVVQQLDQIGCALASLGARLDDPLLAADVLTTAAIPHLRITERGYVRLKTLEMVGLFD